MARRGKGAAWGPMIAAVAAVWRAAMTPRPEPARPAATPKVARRKAVKAPPKARRGVGLALLNPLSTCSADIRGESHAQAALAEICGGYARHGHDLACEAQLTPEPDNDHDPGAVAVMIQGHRVGYLPAERAASYLARLAAAGHEGATVTCPARIVGGWRTNAHDVGHFGVKLALPARGALQIG